MKSARAAALGIGEIPRRILIACDQEPRPLALPSGDTLWYNNTIIQTDPDLVWLPQFAQPDGRFADTEEANRKIWRDLGFKVVPVAGWMAYESSGGSIRCATSVLGVRARAALATLLPDDQLSASHSGPGLEEAER